MTALDKYVRLESGGLWRADPEAQRKDVVVSFGDATLVISDGNGKPLAHWSLPAVTRQNPGERPALFAPDEEGSEVVEIADDLMVDAIEEVRKALARARPKPGKLRHWITGAVAVGVLALGVFWLPGALTRQTLAVVPMTKRVEIGAAMLGHIQAQTGASCREPRGIEAASRLAQRLFGPETSVQIVVLPKLAQGAVSIPGGLILLDYGVVQVSDDPAVTAGYVLAARTAAQADPLGDLLHRAGLGTTFRLLTTGDVPAEVLRAHAEAVLSGYGDTDLTGLGDIFAAAEVPIDPYLATAAARDETVPPIEMVADDAESFPAILNDSDWVSLQNICNV